MIYFLTLLCVFHAGLQPPLATLMSFDRAACLYLPAACFYAPPPLRDVPIHLLESARGPIILVLLPGFLRPVSYLQPFQRVEVVLFLLAGLSLTLFQYLILSPHRFLGQA